MAKYLERLGWETCQNVARFHEQLIVPPYMFVSQAYMLCSEHGNINYLLGKTITALDPGTIISRGSKRIIYNLYSLLYSLLTKDITVL